MIIPENKLYNLYEAVIDGTAITKSNVYSFGLNKDEIRNLIYDGTLKYENDAYYLNDVEALWRYGKRLISLKRKDRAEVCFEKCMEINPNNKKVALQLFMKSLQQKDFEGAFELFKIMDHDENPYVQADLNYYLYMLSFLIVLPPEYNERARNFKIEEIYQGDEKNTESTVLLRKVRMLSLKQLFSPARDQFDAMLKEKQMKFSTTDIITKHLLFYVSEKQHNVTRRIKGNVKKENFEIVLDCVEHAETMHNLSYIYDLIQVLTQDIIDLLTTGKVQERENHIKYPTKAVVAALEHDYEAVLKSVSGTSISFYLAEYLLKLTDKYYGLKDAKELIILISADFFVEDVRTTLELSDENYQLLLAVLAKECYQNGDISDGDAYIRKLECEGGKSRRVEFALRDVKSKRPIEQGMVHDGKSFILDTVKNPKN